MQQVYVVLIGDAARRSQVKAGLRGQPQVHLAGEMGESQALRLVPQLQADVIVLDFGALAVNGLAALPWLATLPGDPAIIVLGASGTATERRLALELGARAYVSPDTVDQSLGPLITTPPRPVLPLARAA